MRLIMSLYLVILYAVTTAHQSFVLLFCALVRAPGSDFAGLLPGHGLMDFKLPSTNVNFDETGCCTDDHIYSLEDLFLRGP